MTTWYHISSKTFNICIADFLFVWINLSYYSTFHRTFRESWQGCNTWASSLELTWKNQRKYYRFIPPINMFMILMIIIIFFQWVFISWHNWKKVILWFWKFYILSFETWHNKNLQHFLRELYIYEQNGIRFSWNQCYSCCSKYHEQALIKRIYYESSEFFFFCDNSSI